MRYMAMLVLMILVALSGCATLRDDAYAGGCVAADHEIASRAGAEILARGGNAVDAAVATSFTLSVVRPYSCGIGGGGFMVIYFTDEGRAVQQRLGRTVPPSLAINYREMAPAAVGPEYYERIADPEASTRGGKAVAIPGTVAGLLSALDRYGTLDRATVLTPAIRAAEEGFIADEHYIASTRELVERFGNDAEYRRRFPFVWDRYLRQGTVRVGDRIVVPEQARVFRAIAERGAAGFYEGEVGQAIIAAIAGDSGEMTPSDLQSFIVEEMRPLTSSAFGHAILSMPPPSSGGLALLQTTTAFRQIAPASPPWCRRPHHASEEEALRRWRHSPGVLHALAEAAKHAFADRARYLADPAFVPVPAVELLLMTSEFANRYDPAGVLPHEAYGTKSLRPVSLPEDGGTSHFCVVDATGSAVACTETINLEFGSLVAVPEFGFLLNNEMDDFTTRRGEPNAFGLTQSELNLPAPGKRPLSSMAPTIAVKDGRVRVIVGASGGPRIISATTQCLLSALLIPSMSSDEILAEPRVHHQWLPDVLWMEPAAAGSAEESLRAQTRADLKRRGHNVQMRREIGNVQMIRRTPEGRWDPACDPRKGGRPAGVPGQHAGP